MTDITRQDLFTRTLNTFGNLFNSRRLENKPVETRLELSAATSKDGVQPEITLNLDNGINRQLSLSALMKEFQDGGIEKNPFTQFKDGFNSDLNKFAESFQYVTDDRGVTIQSKGPNGEDEYHVSIHIENSDIPFTADAATVEWKAKEGDKTFVRQKRISLDPMAFGETIKELGTIKDGKLKGLLES